MKLIDWEIESWNPAGCCHTSNSKNHIQSAPDAIKILHSDEDDAENGVLGGLANKEYSNRRNHSKVWKKLGKITPCSIQTW